MDRRIELTPRGEGTLEWIAWLSVHGAARPADVTSITVVEERLSMPLQGVTRTAVEQAARDALQRLIASSAARDAVAESTACVHASIDEALADEASQRAATLVIGRLALRGEARLVRLGRTARRVLRRLSTPVVVVPPDLGADAIGDGPVVCAIDFRDETMSAVGYATALAQALGRRLVLAHVVSSLVEPAALWLSAAQLEELTREHEQRTRAALDAFIERHELDPQCVEVLAGSPIETLLDFADGKHAPLVVCGSRLLGVAARIVTSSFGIELAAAATMPVALVPPGWER